MVRKENTRLLETLCATLSRKGEQDLDPYLICSKPYFPSYGGPFDWGQIHYGRPLVVVHMYGKG